MMEKWVRGGAFASLASWRDKNPNPNKRILPQRRKDAKVMTENEIGKIIADSAVAEHREAWTGFA